MPRPSAESGISSRKGRVIRSTIRVLVVVDNRPLQHAAWAELKLTRVKVKKLTTDVNRHEQTDVPAYLRWLHQTFPLLLNELRTLTEEVMTKERQVREVEFIAMVSGRSPHMIWRERRSEVPESHEGANVENENSSQKKRTSGRKDLFEDDPNDFDDDDFFFDSDEAQPGNRSSHDKNASGRRSAFAGTPESTTEARDVYRRLVQKLHPDRGGTWTPRREQLWHQAQEAWANRDLDRLLRLENECDDDADSLGPGSPVGRLKRAIKDLIAVQRDAERQLRTYRSSPEWRFSLLQKKRWLMAKRVGAQLQGELERVRQDLEALNIIISRWEMPRTAARGRRSTPRRSR